jgi:uncharacterized protein (UPF0264 family)
LITQARASREIVAAAYADCDLARSLPPAQVARTLQGRYSLFLLDTHTKDGRSVFDHMSQAQLAQLAQQVRYSNARFALAGSLSMDCINKITRIAPDIVGIRGAACDGGRSGQVRVDRVAEFRAALHQTANASRAELQRS